MKFLTSGECRTMLNADECRAYADEHELKFENKGRVSGCTYKFGVVNWNKEKNTRQCGSNAEICVCKGMYNELTLQELKITSIIIGKDFEENK